MNYRTNQRETTAEVLDRLDREHGSGIGSRFMAWAVTPRVVRSGGDVEYASPLASAMAKRRGLVHLGAISEGGRPREVWVDAGSRTQQLHSSPSLYFIITYFDDGSAVLTYGHPNPITPSTPSLLVRSATLHRDVAGGVSGVEAEYDAHETAAAAWAEKRRVNPLPVEDVVTAGRMVRHFYRRLASPSLAPLVVIGRLLHPFG